MYRYPCLVYRQRNNDDAPTFCLFHAPVGDILTWSDIKRIEEEPGAAQRRTQPAKVKAVKTFLERDSRNTIPTSVIITLDLGDDRIRDVTYQEDGASFVCQALEFEFEQGQSRPGLVIDGQHRLLGIRDYDANMRVNVVALLNSDDTEKAFQFLVINNKASKVSTDHIRALALNYEEEQLGERLKSARLSLSSNLRFVGVVQDDPDSPFYKIVALPTPEIPEENRIVVPAAIESAFSYIQQQKVKDFESDDVLIEYFYAIWNAAKSRWGLDLWTKEAKLLSKVGVFCYTQYVTDALVSRYDWGELDLSNPEQIISATEKLLDFQKKEFWQVRWASGSYDTSAGRDLVVSALTTIARNIRTEQVWYEDVAVIDLAELQANQD